MDITISCPCGKVTGNQKPEYNEWLGIKYANAGRYEDPKLVEKWDGEYDARKYSARFQQFKGIFGYDDGPVKRYYAQHSKDVADFDGYSEDAFTLNIFAPKDAKNCPVFFFMHGGGYTSGSNSDSYCTTGSFAKEGIVSVFINYRVTVFASAIGDGCTGNYSVKDQIAALLWTYKNIEAFGGDPSRITIAGESAGAYSVQNLLNTDKIPDGVINGAIMMSGAGDTRPLSLLLDKETQVSIWEDVKKAANVNSINDLKTMPQDELYKIWSTEGLKHTPFYSSPIVDGDIIKYHTRDAIANGKMKNVPLILGMLSEDMFPIFLYKAIMEIAAAREKQGGAPVYSYFFDCQLDPKFGAYHASDIPYAFNTIEFKQPGPSKRDEDLRDDLFTSFCNFIKNGDPRKGDSNSSLAGPWLSMQESGNKFYELNGEKHGMYSPDPEKLTIQTKTGKPFPEAEE